jgi:D-cysteine desulfhydrase
MPTNPLLPPRTRLAHLPTPLVPMDRLSKTLGGPRLWLKRDDLTDTTASGNKLRKLEFSVARAQAEQATILITCGGVQSNHCRATAVVASQLGLKCHLLLRGRRPPVLNGNLLLDEILGAEVSYLSAAAFADLDQQVADLKTHYAARGEHAFFIPMGASDETGLWGYIEACAELQADFRQAGIKPAAIVSATGSGGTLAGLMLGKQRYGLETDIVAFNVCDDGDTFTKKIRRDFSRWEQRYQQGVDTRQLPINIIEGYVGPGYARANAEIFATIAMVARTEGVIFDPVYTGKAFHGLLAELAKGSFEGADDIVFLHTGGLFGVFPFGAEMFPEDDA